MECTQFSMTSVDASWNLILSPEMACDFTCDVVYSGEMFSEMKKISWCKYSDMQATMKRKNFTISQI